MFASTTSIIGSGWLFGSFHAAKLAGPLAIRSWIVGGFIIMLIALCFAELAALFPKSGALVHMSHASHGEGLGRVWARMLFLAYVAVPSVEAEAVVTYANNYLLYFIQPNGAGLLTTAGFFVCAALLAIFAWLNLLGAHTPVRHLRRNLVENCGSDREENAFPVSNSTTPGNLRSCTLSCASATLLPPAASRPLIFSPES